MKSKEFITVYAASNQWKISESFFEVLKSISNYSQYFSGSTNGYGQNLVSVEALPIIKNLYDQNVKDFNDYNGNSNFINMGTLLKGVLKTPMQIKDMIDSGKYKDLYVRLLRRKKPDPVFGPYIYYFKYDFLEKCENMTTGLIKKALSKKGIIVSDATILTYKKNGELAVNVNLYGLDTMHLNEVESLVLEKKKDKFKKSQKQATENSNFSVLNFEQQQLIEDYLSFRNQGGRISHNNYRAKKHIANKEEHMLKLKSGLATFFFRIICLRCRIELQPKMRYAFLTEEEKKQYNPEILVPLEIDEDDVFAFTTNSKTTTAVNVYQTIKPFYAWILQRRKAAASTPEKWFTYGQLERRIEFFLDQFPVNYNEIPVNEKINRKEKAFLTREQLILVRKKILHDPLSHNPFKFATIWEICCVSGLRPYEIRKLKIEHFLLDNNGLLALNNRGWGVLHLPREASKHERSPSHPLYGTPIPPGTVKRINEYLKRLYKKQRNEPVGVGYMFRPEDLFPESGYKSPIIDMTRLKEQLDFLPIEQRNDFELKAARRSMNNLIDGFSVKLPNERLNGRIQKVAADIQMRHQITGDIGEKHYTAPISEDDFYAVLDLTINFPWDINELKEWEKKVFKEGVDPISKLEQKRTELHTDSHTESASTHFYNISEFTERQLEIKKELNKLRKRPKELSMEEWFKKREDLEREFLSAQ